MSKHYSCELGELRGDKKRDGWTDKLRERNFFHIEASKAYARSKNKYSHANENASLKCMQTQKQKAHT